MLTEQNGIQVDKFYPPTDWQYSFPEGYTRLEYLQGDGKAYINTGITASQDTILKCRVSSNNTGTQAFIGLSDSGLYGIGQQSADNLLFAQYKTSDGANRILSDIAGNDGIIRNFELRKNEFYINNTYIGNNTAKTFTTTEAIKLFTFNTTTISKVKIYSVQIYSDTTLQANLFPAKRNSDGVLGMYNLVSNEFYTNAGTGEFVMGPELYSNNSQIDIRQKNNTNFVEKYKFNANNELVWANPNLYLENVNNSYIQIEDFYNLDTDEIIVDFLVNAPRTGQTNQGPFYSKCSGTYGINMSRDYAYIDNKKWSLSSFNTKDGNRIILNAKQMNLTINGATPSQTTDNTQKLTNNLRLFRSTNGYLIGKIFSFIWKRNGVEIYHLVPVKKGLIIGDFTVPSNGMFDIINQQFYENNGSGTFNFGHQRDLKVIPPEDNIITLLYGVTSDFSKYSLFGLVANVSSGTYDVYIDDVLYATTASETQTDIDFSTLGTEYVSIGTATTPEELVLHKIVIKPTTSGATITKFRVALTDGATGTQRTGLLWCHFELDNELDFSNLFNNSSSNQYECRVLLAHTAKNDTISMVQGTNIGPSYRSCVNISYIPYIKNATQSFSQTFQNANLIKRLRLHTKEQSGSIYFTFTNTYALEQINIKNKTNKSRFTSSSFNGSRNLKLLPFNNTADSGTMTNTLTQGTMLYPTKIDATNSITSTNLVMSGTSTYPMRGLQGLKVSNEAPFTGTRPQINISYTGLDRDALVELFESMPYNVGYTQPEGSDVVINNGIASDFSEYDYLELLNLGERFSVVDKWETVIKIHTSSTHTGQCIFGDDASYGTNIRLNSENKLVFQASNSTSSVDIGEIYGDTVLSDDTDYYIKIEFTGNEYNLYYSTNNTTWTLEGSFNSSTKITNRNTKWLYGMYSVSSWYFRGSIDLNNTYIKIYENNEWIPWFTGKAARASNPQINITAATGNNITKVGTPTIDTNGVVSGFSSSNYFETSNVFDNSIAYNNGCVFQIKVTLPSETPSSTQQLFYAGFSTATADGFTINNSGILAWYIFGSTNILRNYDKPLIFGNTYVIRGIIKNGVATLYCGADENHLEQYATKILVVGTLQTACNILFGVNRSKGNAFSGSIDLENTYIKIGQNYFMKGYLLDSDRAIATNKGWTITG